MTLNFDENGKVIVPKIEQEFREKQVSKKKIKDNSGLLEDYWETIDFNCEELFKSMKFIGGITGRKNRYYCYKFDKFIMLSTGFKDDAPTRASILLNSEIDFMNNFLHEIYKKYSYSGLPVCRAEEYLIENRNKIPNELYRIKCLVEDHLNKNERDYLYYFILNCYYILSIVYGYFLDQSHKRIILVLNEKENLESLPNLFENSNIIGFDRWRVIFQKGKFYFTYSFRRPFRGISYVYDEREINYLIEMLKNNHFYFSDIWKDRIEINTSKMLNHINEDQNNICLVCYREIMARNLRNKKGQFDYTESRLKIALRIIKNLNNNIVLDKDGRKIRYFKRK